MLAKAYPFFNLIFMKKLIYLSFICLIVSCSGGGSSDNGDYTPTGDDVDRRLILDNIVNNIIIPSHQELFSKIDQLGQAATIFSSNQNQTNLDELRLKYFDSYKSWQYVEMFCGSFDAPLGYAGEMLYQQKSNGYPTNTTRINDNVNSLDYDLDNNNNNNPAQGFPAIDFLIYGLGDSDLDIIEAFVNEENYGVYLVDLIQHLRDNTQQVLNYWIENGPQFASDAGNTATSSFNILFNSFVYYYEKGFRANKFGIPAGRWPGGINPEKVEAYYSQTNSKDLALEAMTSIRDFFIGRGTNGTIAGQSFKTYLEEINEEDLASEIISIFETASNSINSLPDNFSTCISSDNGISMLEVYNDIQLAVVKLKTEMASKINVSIEYTDADGD